MSYEIFILRRAEKELRKISQSNQQKIRKAIGNLSIEPKPTGCKKLKGRPAWRIRVGVYRIIYEISDRKLIITVIDIGHRRDIYR
ncbi:MAG: type II toxin-antitoxin system RelE/ParE family toxin [Cyanobacteria bacterium P01_A01_bin.83]